MASEDLFEDFSEEIITELDQDYVEAPDIVDEEEVDNEPEESEEVVEETEESVTNSVEEGSAAPGGEEAKKPVTTAAKAETKLFQLPLARIRNIMKLDPDLHIASNEAVFLVSRATELFIESLAVESYSFTAQAKKKTVQKRDVDLAVAAVDSLMFLDGAMTF